MRSIYTTSLAILLTQASFSQTTPYPGTPALGLKCWLKADLGIIGGPAPITQWNDQSGAGITGDFVPSFWDICPPDFQTNLFNYNPAVAFDLSSPNNWCGTVGLYSQNAFAGNDLFDPLENTIFMVKEMHYGLVDFKWEDNFIGNAYRIGSELSSTPPGKQRFDFVNASSGQLVSNTTIQNVFHIGTLASDANNLSIYLNGNLDASIPNPGLSFNPPVGNLNGLSIGSNPPIFPLSSDEYLSEVMVFNKKLSFSERRRVESYLAIKYGITIGNNQGSGPSLDYIASDETLIWDNHAGFHNHVIGIGKDGAAGASGLNQFISKGEASFNGTTDMLKIANGSFATPAPFDDDGTFIVVGSNLGSLTTPIYGGFLHANPSTGISAFLSRSWAIQKTGAPVGNLILEFDMALIPGPNANANIRLLLDNDLNYGNNSIGESTYAPLTGFSISGGSIYFSVPYSSIPAKGYFTLGSTDVTLAPLPITVVSFSANCNDNANLITWTTSLKDKCVSYELERSTDGINFLAIDKQICNNNKTLFTYVDELPETKPLYTYRLKGFINGNKTETLYTTLQPCSLTANKLAIAKLFSQNGIITADVETNEAGQYEVCLISITGFIVVKETIQLKKGLSQINLTAPDLKTGLYTLKILGNNKSDAKKIVVSQNN